MSDRTPSAEQLQAVCDYADYYGAKWKAKLSGDWMRAGSEWSGPYHLLHQLRNQFGPKWLAAFAFTDGDRCGQ